MSYSIVAWWVFLVVGLFLSHSNSLWTVAYFCVSKWRRVYARTVFIIICTIPPVFPSPFFIHCVRSQTPISMLLSVKNSPPLCPWKGSSCVFKENGCNCISLGSQSFCILNISAVTTPTGPLVILSEKHQSLITEKVIPITLRFGQFLICKYSETLKLNMKATAKLLTWLSNSTVGCSPPCDFGSAH